jgi:hypothetical protein
LPRSYRAKESVLNFKVFKGLQDCPDPYRATESILSSFGVFLLLALAV